MHSRFGLTAILFLLAALCFAPAIFAGNASEDIIVFDSEEGKVAFGHKTHFETYYKEFPEFYGSSCGECHHDKDNKALTDLKVGDEVQKCVECHKKPGYLKGKEARGLSKEQKREYVANAVHDNCKGCHSDYNKSKKLKPQDEGYAPNTCKTCHVKGE